MAAYEAARAAGYDAVNMDLIAGLPGDDPKSFADSLRQVLALAPENVTVHTLALKKGADLYAERMELPSADDVAQMLAGAEASLRAAGDTPEKLCFLHYPPRYRGYECPEILALLERYGVKECCYGHLHGSSHRLAIEGVHHGVTYRLCAADYTNFAPIRLR